MINDGGPAFPQAIRPTDIGPAQTGMSLRDWYAGQAMQGMLCRNCNCRVSFRRRHARRAAEAMSPAYLAAAIARLPWPWDEWFAERAAIREFDGNQTRAEAEEAAYREVQEIRNAQVRSISGATAGPRNADSPKRQN